MQNQKIILERIISESTHKSVTSRSSSDAEEITMLSEQMETLQLQRSTIVRSLATLCSETLGACRQFSNEMGEPSASELSFAL